MTPLGNDAKDVDNALDNSALPTRRDADTVLHPASQMPFFFINIYFTSLKVHYFCYHCTVIPNNYLECIEKHVTHRI